MSIQKLTFSAFTYVVKGRAENGIGLSSAACRRF